MGQLVTLNNFDRPIDNDLLPSPSIKSLYQDSKGFVWSGTTVGLLRIDGNATQVYQHDPADNQTLSNSAISRDAIIEHAGFLWIGTSNGLNRYDYTSDTFLQYLNTEQTDPDQCGESVNVIVQKDAHTLWLGTNNGLCEFDIRTGDTRVFQHNKDDPNSLSSNLLSSIVKDPSGNLWIGTVKGVNLVDTSSFQVRRFLDKESAENPSGNLTTIHTLYLENETLWIGTLKGFTTLNTSTFSISNPLANSASEPILGKAITSFLRDESQNLWIATFDKGLCKLSGNMQTIECFKHEPGNPFSIIDNRASALLLDSEEQLWVGTWAGLCKLGKNPGFESIIINHNNVYKPEPAVSAILEVDSTNVLIGTAIQGMYSGKTYVTASDSITKLNELKVRSIAKDGDLFWIGTAGNGVHSYDPRSHITKPFGSSISGDWIYNVLIDDNGQMWTSSATTGLTMLPNKAGSVSKRYKASRHPDSLSSNQVWPIMQDAAGAIWLGTMNGGLNKYDRNSGLFKRYIYEKENPHSISHNDIMHIAEDAEGLIWVGTLKGTNSFDPGTGKFTSYSVSDGLADNQVFCVLPDNQKRVWMATRQGLSVLDRESKQFTNFYEENGLPKSQFFPNACHKGPSGRFYFGTEQGLLTFLPENIELEDTAPPPIVITSFELNNVKTALKPVLDLTYEQNTLTFYVAALSFINPAKNEISYRLLGADSTWITLTSPDIRFTDLVPGDYTLEITATNSFGHRSKSTFTQSFSIAPPYWRTWWFGFLILLVLSLMGYTGYQIRLNYLLGLARKTYEAELKIAKLRNDLAADFHDGLGSSLGSLGIDMNLLATQSDMPETIKRQLYAFIEKLHRISAVRREMSWFIDAKHDSLKHLLDRIPQVAFDIIPKEKLQLSLPQNPPDVQLPMSARRHLLFFLKEAMYNAAKHANASTISVQISGQAQNYNFCVIDNGTGFDPKTVNRGKGLSNLEHRAASIQGQLSFIPNKPSGTIVQLTVNMEGFSHNES